MREPCKRTPQGNTVLKTFVCNLVLLLFMLPAIGMAGQFDKEWKRCVLVIRGNYYAMATKGKAVEDLIQKYGQAALQASSREQFKKTLGEMFKEIGDSHFDLQLEGDPGFYILDGILKGGHPSKMPFIGAFFSDNEPGWKVDMIFPGSSAEKAGLRKGDLITGVNGNPFTPVQSLKKLKGKAEFEVVRSDQKLRLEMEVRKIDLWQAALESTRHTVRIIEQNGKKVGYIKLLLMLDPRVLQLMIESMTITFKDTDAVILDLRDGSGGSADGYPDVFFRPAIATERNSATTQDKRVYGYAKPVALLVGKGTVSAKETFTYMMKASKRAKIVGSRTAGALLGAGSFRISSWAILTVPRVNVLLDGNRIEGLGIEPDILVETEYGPDGEDLVLREALRALGM
jgi:carboxyl-terminal processing protease